MLRKRVRKAAAKRSKTKPRAGTAARKKRVSREMEFIEQDPELMREFSAPYLDGTTAYGVTSFPVAPGQSWFAAALDAQRNHSSLTPAHRWLGGLIIGSS